MDERDVHLPLQRADTPCNTGVQGTARGVGRQPVTAALNTVRSMWQIDTVCPAVRCARSAAGPGI